MLAENCEKNGRFRKVGEKWVDLLKEHYMYLYQKLLQTYHAKNICFEVQFHVDFEKIHPFQDGHGRVLDA